MKITTSFGIVAALALFLLIPSIPFAQNETPDIKGLEQLAKKKDTGAQLKLGEIYYYGDGVPVDYKKAEKWLKKAADNGVAEADYLLGLIYFDGLVGKPDIKKGLQFMTDASDAGNADAQFYLGRLYDLGTKVPQDFNKALSLYTSGAEGGSLEAQILLAEMYDKGLRVPMNKAKGIQMKELASANGATQYLNELGYTYLEGTNVNKNPEKALYYLLEADKAGDTSVQHSIGLLYLNENQIKNEAEAIPMLLKSASQGHFEDYYLVGKIYLTGRGNVPSDYNKAFNNILLAYNNKYTEATPLLGLLYFYGIGTPADRIKAVGLFVSNPNDAISAYSYLLCQDLDIQAARMKIVSSDDYAALSYYIKNNKLNSPDINILKEVTKRMAHSGDTYAEYSMGNLLRFNIGLDKSEETTAEQLCNIWYKKSADKMLPQAQDFLGDCYYEPIGISLNFDEAARYYAMAADQDYARAQRDLGLCYEKGTGVAKNLETALRLYRLAADKGFADAQCSLGLCYEEGTGVTKDYSTALRYYRMAADKGSPYGEHCLGDSYYLGYGVPQNYDEAYKYFKMAADKGLADAFTSLGTCYYEGKGVPQSYSQAYSYYKTAIEMGDSQAYVEMGDLYYNGKGVQQDYKEAVKYYTTGAAMRNSQAINNLAECYEDGEGVYQDLQEAKRLYRQAADMGNEDAIKSLHRLARPSLNILPFAQIMDSQYRSYSACKAAVTAALAKNGFSLEDEGKKMVEEDDPYDDGTIKFEISWLEFSDGRTSILFELRDWGNEWEVRKTYIYYSSKYQADNFVAASKSALGSKLENQGDNHYYYNTRRSMYYGVGLNQDEYKIELILCYDD